MLQIKFKKGNFLKNGFFGFELAGWPAKSVSGVSLLFKAF
jgi:hypothetical protein